MARALLTFLDKDRNQKDLVPVVLHVILYVMSAVHISSTKVANNECFDDVQFDTFY